MAGVSPFVGFIFGVAYLAYMYRYQQHQVDPPPFCLLNFQYNLTITDEITGEPMEILKNWCFDEEGALTLGAILNVGFFYFSLIFVLWIGINSVYDWPGHSTSRWARLPNNY